MGKLFESGLALSMFLFFLLIYFPGGTLLMAWACNSRRLTGLDWVLSVIVPAYGFLKAVFNVSCR